MKNSRIFPFERNKYYYGKLLSVDDFNLEQKYFCNKQRMNHKYLNGCGVIGGMQTVQVDEQTISVEAGCALDSNGREIVIHEPVLKKLEFLDGFEQSSRIGGNFLYLCIEYVERESSPVYNIAGNSRTGSASDQEQYNKIQESYRLFLTTRRPDYYGDMSLQLFEDVTCIYQGKDILITQTVPKYANSKGKVKVQVHIETFSKDGVAFSYVLNLKGLFFEKKAKLTVAFDEMLHEKTGAYTLNYELDVSNTHEMDASITMKKDSFILSEAGKVTNAHADGKQKIRITSQDIKKKMIEEYFCNSSMESVKKEERNYLYLARIYLLKASETYLIDHIVNIPFGQYVMNHKLYTAIAGMFMNEKVLTDTGQRLFDGGEGKTADIKRYQKMDKAFGVYEMKIGMKGNRQHCFYSEPIHHGLGIKPVFIKLSVETFCGELISGDVGIFKEDEPVISMATKVNKNTGTFVIGIKLEETVEMENIKIHWEAECLASDKEEEIPERRISIKPGMLELGIGKTCQLEVVFSNIEDERVQWMIQDNGGEIDEANTYTAPNEKGVYEIVAQSIQYPDIRASIFAIIRER